MQSRRPFLSGVGVGFLLLLAIGASPARAETFRIGCSEAQLQAILNSAPPGDTITITFDCGGSPASPATIPITSTLLFGAGVTSIVDGGGTVILHGEGPGPLAQADAGTAVTLQNMTITGTTGGATGALAAVSGGSLTLINTTIFNNAASTPAIGRGGGAIVQGGTLNVVNSTFTGNSATQLGNDIDAEAGGVANLTNSILLDGCGVNAGGSFTDLGGNVATDGSCGMVNGVNGSVVTAVTPILAPVRNGLFFPLAMGSPAFGLDTANCPAQDELGQSRASRCNAGAIERVPVPAPALTPSALALSALLLAGLGFRMLRRRA